MPTPGRSLDDLPLAAYSTGVDPDTEPEMDPDVAAAPAVPAAATAAAPGVLGLATFDGPAAPAAAVGGPAAGTTVAIRARARAFARRNPRPVAGAAFVGMILLGVLLLGGGGGPSANGASASPSAPPVVTVAADPGAATLVLTGALDATYNLTGSGGQPVAGNAVSAAWADQSQNVLTLDGPVDRGTRTTDAGLVLTWGLVIDGKLVTFTSDHGECTIGMAVNPKNVSGSFACRKLKSDDGTYTVGARGTYRT